MIAVALDLRLLTNPAEPSPPAQPRMNQKNLQDDLRREGETLGSSRRS
jgi:hypothetical protein